MGLQMFDLKVLSKNYFTYSNYDKNILCVIQDKLKKVLRKLFDF